MKQSKMMSMLESVINIAFGFGISLVAQIEILPLLGVEISLSQNFQFALIMTVISIARSFGLRRLFEALHIRRPLSAFMQAVIAECYRQRDAEGWSIEHDDAHHVGELASAGAAYLLHAGTQSTTIPGQWPWADGFKPAGRRRDLVRGVALGIAEGEKCDRDRKSGRGRL